MSDELYFLCIGVSIGGAVGYPVFGRWALYERSGTFAVYAGVMSSLCMLGTMFCANADRDLNWLPMVAGIYVMGVTITFLLMSLSRLFPPSEPAKRGFEPVIPAGENPRK